MRASERAAPPRPGHRSALGGRGLPTVAACALLAAAALSAPRAYADQAPRAVPDEMTLVDGSTAGARVLAEDVVVEPDRTATGSVPLRGGDGGFGDLADAGPSAPDGSTALAGCAAAGRGATCAPPLGGQLPATGVTYVDQMLAAGGLLVLLGVGTVLLSRRRRTDDR